MMNDERKSPDTGQLDESFNEDFDFGEGETESHPIKTTSTKGGNKKIIGLIFIVVVIVVLIMGYRVYRPKLSTKPVQAASKNIKETPEQIKQQSEEFANAISGIVVPPEPKPTPVVPVPTPVQTPVPTPVPTPTPIPSSPIATTLPSEKETHPEQIPSAAEVAKLHEGLNKLNTQIDSILSQIKYLDAYSREVSDNLNKLNESISTMDSRLLALTNTTSTLSKDVGNVKSEVGYVKEVLREDGLDVSPDFSPKKKQGHAEKEGRIAIEEPEYTVHAVVPGRAWLKSSKGQIVTVAEGDSIGNYGKILVIDAANGVVLTSSGVAFR